MSQPFFSDGESVDSRRENLHASDEPGIGTEGDNEKSVLDLFIILAKRKKLIVGLPLVTALMAAGISLLLPDIYTANTTILPPQQSQSAAAALLAQLGNVGGVGGLGGGRSTNDIYVAMLKSRTVRDRLIERGLIGNARNSSQARSWPAEVVTIDSGKAGTINIVVDGPNPKRAADLANAYVEELSKFTQELAVTEASQRRLFFERQFAEAKDNLASAEATARQALARGGLVKVDDQGRAMIEATARLRAEMTVKEVLISSMRTFAADRNPELQRVQQELESLKRELAKIEGTGTAKAAASSSGTKGIDNLGLLRNLKYYETIFEMLARQYELAKIDEAKDTSIIQVMDKAIEPTQKSKPNRILIVIWSALAALLAGILLAFVREVVAEAYSDPEKAERLRLFKRYMAWR